MSEQRRRKDREKDIVEFDERDLEAALLYLMAVANVNGMSVYNDTKVDAIKEYEGEYVRWTVHPELAMIEGPCVYCDGLDGTVFDIDEVPDFPAHVSCNCELVYVSDVDPDDVVDMDDFIDYDAWRDSGEKAKKLLFDKWLKDHAITKKDTQRKRM